MCIFVVLYCRFLLGTKANVEKYATSFRFCNFLGRLPKVDLVILEGENVRPYARPYFRPSVHKKISSISMKFGIQVEVDE